jgi:hypothetical protein
LIWWLGLTNTVLPKFHSKSILLSIRLCKLSLLFLDYERTWPIYKGQAYKSYHNPKYVSFDSRREWYWDSIVMKIFWTYCKGRLFTFWMVLVATEKDIHHFTKDLPIGPCFGYNSGVRISWLNESYWILIILNFIFVCSQFSYRNPHLSYLQHTIKTYFLVL